MQTNTLERGLLCLYGKHCRVFGDNMVGEAVGRLGFPYIKLSTVAG